MSIFNNKMKSIEYNTWMSIMELLKSKIPNLVMECNYSIDRDIKVAPLYPRDLTKLYKPSIIVRKVSITQSRLSMDGFVGQYHDDISNTDIDVHGVLHDIEYQLDTCADSNAHMAIVESIIHDVFNDLIASNGGKFILYDYTGDINNPSEIGVVKIMKDPWSIPLSSDSGNNDYLSATRIPLSVVQTIVPTQDFIDLSKWIKQSYTIKI